MSNDTTRRKAGAGSVKEYRPGKWRARITSGVKADGTPRTLSKVFDSQGEAESWLRARSVELSSRPDVGAGITLRVLWDVYKADREGKLAKKTMAVYRWYMEGAATRDGHAARETWLDAMGDVEIADITPSMAQRHISTMGHASGRHAKTTLSSVLSWAVGNDLLASNPLRAHKFEYAPAAAAASFDDDPFAAIEGVRDVWGVETILECFERIRGLPLEPAWLACIGAGLRVEESLALRGMDVRRADVGARTLTQLAIHAARTDMDERKATKTRQSVRIASMMEPFGERYWEIAREAGRDALVCPVSAANQNKRWRGYFAEPSTSKHAPRKAGCNNVGALHGLPYVPLSKMRNTHVTLMAELGVPDSVNALMHGHTEMVERRHYLSPDVTDATIAATERFKLVV